MSRKPQIQSDVLLPLWDISVRSSLAHHKDFPSKIGIVMRTIGGSSGQNSLCEALMTVDQAQALVDELEAVIERAKKKDAENKKR